MTNQYPFSTSDSKYIGSVSGAEDRITDPRQALRALKRHMWLFFLVLISVFVLVAAYTLQATPIYTAQASVIIDSRETNVVDLGSVLSGLPPEATVVDTEVEIIRSRILAQKVAKALDLKSNPEFNPTLREPGFVHGMKSTLKSWFSRDDNPNQLTGEDAERAELDAVVSTLLSRTSARRIGTTYGLEITASSEDPKLAAEIANKIVDQYLVEQLDAKFDATRRANAWLEDRLAELKDEVSVAESLVENYRNESGLITAGNSTLSEQQISDLSAQLITQRAELAEAEARLQSINQLVSSGRSADVSGEALSSPVISELRRQQAEIIRERADLLNRYGSLHPDVQRINTEAADIETQISNELRRIASNLESEAAIARQRVQSLERSLSSSRANLAQNNRASVRLRELERNAEASRSIYEAFLARFKQTNEQEGLAEADARILSSAVVPNSPTFPKTSLNLVLGLFGGLFMAIGSVVAAETFASHISSGDEIEQRFSVPFLGNIPRLTGRQKEDVRDYLMTNQTSAYAESFRNLRASIMFADLDTKVQTVAITSSQPDEGKTTVSQSLGLISASAGSKTLVIDGDFRRTRLSNISADKAPEKGFLECLFGECTVQEAVIEDEDSGLHILPLTPTHHTPRDVFGSKAFDILLKELKGTYDFIIIDTGPILLLSETRVLASKMDQVVVVSRWLKTSRAALKQTLAILSEFRADVAGVVLNQVDTQKYHSLGYGHSGYKAYSKYYT